MVAGATPITERLDTFRLDVKCTQVASALQAAGIGVLLLKGPAFDQLLFGGTRSRSYADIDLLVEPDRARHAQRVLERLGFHRAKRRTRLGAALGRPGHATAWVRAADRFTVDLHTTLPQVGIPAPMVWRALRANRITIDVVGARIATLDGPASALLIALHAAHHGPAWNRAQTDLRQACELLDRECWHAAARLARELRAERGMGIGLATAEDGRGVADQLGLPTKPTVAYRLRWSTADLLERWRASGTR